MNKPFKKDNICAIIVCFKFEVNKIKGNIFQHLKNFSTIILVNNSPEISLDSFKSSQVIIINNPSNIGLASALNIGILEAKKQGAEMVSLFDQDTLLPSDFTQNMLKHIQNRFKSNICDGRDLYLTYWNELFSDADLFNSPKIAKDTLYGYISVLFYKLCGIKAYFKFRYIFVQKLKR